MNRSDHIRHYRPAEVQELLGVSRARLYSWLATGALPSIKIGRSRHVSAADLAEFLDARRQEAGLPTREEG